MRKTGGEERGEGGGEGDQRKEEAASSPRPLSRPRKKWERRGVVCKISGWAAPGAKLNVSTKYPFTVTRYGARCTASMSF